MRGKDFNTGLRGVLFEARHYERMGSAVWLYAWLVLRQTHQTGSTGWVLGGAPISYQEIEDETGFNRRTLERWMSTLRRHGYVETEPAMGGVIVRITKAKKHAATRSFAAGDRVEAYRRAADGLRKLAGEVRISAEGNTQNCVADRGDVEENTHVPLPISSSSLEESVTEYGDTTSRQHASSDFERLGLVSRQISKDHTTTAHHIKTVKPFCSGKTQNHNTNESQDPTRDLFSDPGRTPRIRDVAPQQPWRLIEEARLRQQFLRTDRGEAVRRELRVGAGPQISNTPRETTPTIEVKRS